MKCVTIRVLIAVAMVTAIPQAKAESIAFFANSNYVDMSREGPNFQNTLLGLGHTINEFTGISAADFNSAVSGSDLLVIPELEKGDLNSQLTVEARDTLRSYVEGGGGIVQLGDFTGNGLELSNALFSYSLELVSRPPSATFSLDATAAAGTPFEGGPSVLPHDNGVYGVESDSLPVGALNLYHDTTNTSFLIASTYGRGHYVRLGFDWWAQTTSPEWTSVAGSAVSYAVSNSDPLEVLLDIKPGPSNNTVALNGNGTLQMAILASEELDVSDIDIDSLLFGDPLLIDDGATPLGATSDKLRDLNHDGLDDLLVGFSISGLVDGGALDVFSVEGRLTGELFDGTPIFGSDIVRMVPQNKGAGGSQGLSLTRIPEPSSVVLLAFGMLVFLKRGQRRF